MKISDEISYDFNKRMFDFIHSCNNNIAQYYLMSQEEKNKIIELTKPKIIKNSKNTYFVTMI